jgi:hypothetical protein
MVKMSIQKLAGTTTEKVTVRYVATIGDYRPFEEVSLVGLYERLRQFSGLNWPEIEDALEKDGAWISKED